jgi:hypothetical protein
MKKSIVATGILALYFVFDILFWEPVFNLSNRLAISMQSWNNNYIEAVFIILSFFGYGTAFGSILIFLFFKSSNKIEVIKIITMLSLCVYIMGVLKILHSVRQKYFFSLFSNSNHAHILLTLLCKQKIVTSDLETHLATLLLP